MTAIRNALGRARAGVARGLAKVRAGIVDAAKAPVYGARWVRGKSRQATASIRQRVASATEGPRGRLERGTESARANPRRTVAIAATGLIAIAWIAWAIYVTASNGANAGLGVVLTWPVLLGALALLASPFVLTGMLVRRNWPGGDDPPPISGGANGSDPPEEPETYPG